MILYVYVTYAMSYSMKLEMTKCVPGILAIADRQHSHGSNIGLLPCSRAMPRCHEPCATARRSRRFSDSPCRCRGRKPTAGSQCFECLGLHQRIVVLEAAKEELSNLAALQREELQYLNNRQGMARVLMPILQKDWWLFDVSLCFAGILSRRGEDGTTKNFRWDFEWFLCEAVRDFHAKSRIPFVLLV